MTRYEHLFLKLSEECAEVQQRVSKLLQFGAGESEPGQTLTNAQRLRAEVNDLLSVIALLEGNGYLRWQSDDELSAHKLSKAEKIKKYLNYSEELGLVKP